MLKNARLAAIGVVAVLAGALGAAAIDRFRPFAPAPRVDEASTQPAASALPSVAIGGPFDLIGGDGAPVRDSSFPGKWLLVYFGYTTCPDVCPTTLQAIASALDRLGPRGEKIVPLFITVDPQRDRPDVMQRYTKLFSPRIIGMTGSAAQIAAAETGFRVYAAPVRAPGANGYTMDHTSFIYLMSPDGRLRALFDRSATAASIAAGIASSKGWNR